MAFISTSGIDLISLSTGKFDWGKTVSTINKLTKTKNGKFVYPDEILDVWEKIESLNLFKPDKIFPDEWNNGKDVHKYCISGKINYTKIIAHKTTLLGCSHPNKFVLIAGPGNHVVNISDIHANEDSLNALVKFYCDYSGKLMPNVIWDVNGDMINRGKTPEASVRTLLLFMILRVKNRKQLVLKRGNHELEAFIRQYGRDWLAMFPSQKKVLDVILKIFAQLPFISYVGHEECGILIVHGAPPGYAKNIREIFCENLNTNNIIDGYTHIVMSKEPTLQERKTHTIHVYLRETDKNILSTVCHNTLEQVEKINVTELQNKNNKKDFTSKLQFPKTGYKAVMLNPWLVHYITLACKDPSIGDHPLCNEASIEQLNDEKMLERNCGRYVSFNIISRLQTIFGKPVYIFTGHKHGNSGIIYKNKWSIIISSEEITEKPCVGYCSPDGIVRKLTFVEALNLAESLKQKSVDSKSFGNLNVRQENSSGKCWC